MRIKTTCLALTCAAFIPAANAGSNAENIDYSFYGSLRAMVESTKHENGDDFKDALSRIGIKGSHDLGNGLSGFALYELKVDIAEGELGSETGKDARQAYIGLSGDFGTVMAGRYWSAFYNAIAWAPDQLLLSSAPVYYTLDANFHIGKSVMYTSPDLNGLQVSALYSNEVEQSQFAATYRISDSLKVAAGMINDDENDSAAVAVYYNTNGYYLNGMYMDKDNTGQGADIMGGVTSGKNSYALGVSTFEDSTDAGNDFDAVILSYQHAIHPQMQFWLEASAWDGVLYGTPDSNVTRVGIKYDF